MKKISLLIILAASLVVCSNFALAAAEMEFSSDSLDFGEIDWDGSSSESITLTNTGNETLTNIVLSHTANSSYYISFNSDNFNLTAGASKTISVSIDPTNDPYLDGGNETIGNLEADSDQTSKINIPIIAYLPERLHIKSIDGKVAGKTDSDVQDGDKISETATPGDSVEFTVKLENTFDSDDDEYSIRNVRIMITIIDIDNGDDIERETVKTTMDAGSSKTETLKFEVPSTATSDKYDILVEISGENEETGEDYDYEVNLELEVEKRKNDIIITKFELNPAELSCSLSTTAHLELLNQGQDKENNVVLEIKSSDLNINERVTSISLGKDDDSDAKYQTDIALNLEKDTLVKKYTLTANVYYDGDKLDDQEIAVLDFKECGSSTNTTSVNQTKTNATSVTVNQTKKIINDTERPLSRLPPSVIIGEVKDSIINSKFFWPLAGLFGLVFIILMSVIIAHSYVKKQD